jgi:hypothetical protein
MKDTKKTYEKLRKKHRLPKLEELIREFAIKPETPELILHDIVDRIKEEVFDRAKILESIIFVRTSSDPSYLYETKMLEEKREAFELFKELMSIGWKGERAKIIAKEEEMASFIKEAYDRWTKELKKKFIEICELFERKWKDAELKESPSLMYHG